MIGERRFDDIGLWGLFAVRKIGAAVLAGMGLAWSAEGQTVDWLVFDAPPMYIREGPLANQGSSDEAIALLTSRLPNYRHRTTLTTFARAWYQIRHSDGICIVGVSKTPERESFAKFSESIFNGPGNVVVTLTENKPKFLGFLNGEGRLDLQRLDKDSLLTGAYASSRSYGHAVSDYLSTQDHHAKIEAFPNEFQLFNLLMSQRVDYFFAYKAELNYFKTINNINTDFSVLPIEGDHIPVTAYVACSDQPLGRAVIDDVNGLLADPAIRKSIQDFRTRWTDN